MEAWVVDAKGNEVASTRTDTDTQGKPLEFMIPVNPGKVGLTVGPPTARANTVTIPATLDRDGSVRVTARKVIDRTTGKYGSPKTAHQAMVAGKRDYVLEISDLEPASDYDYAVTATNPYGDENPIEGRSFATLPVFGFKNALEVSITPIGFLVTFEATDVPDSAGLRVKGKGFLRENSATMSGKVAKLSLDLTDTKEFLKTGDAQPTLEAFVKKNGQEVTQQIKVAFEPLDTAKAKIQALSLDQTEKDKLIAAVDGVSKKRWGGTWGSIIPEVFKLALTFIK